MQRNCFRGVLAGAVMLGAISCIALAAPGDVYVLKRVFKAGEVDKYKTVITLVSPDKAFTDGPLKLDITIIARETVKEVKKDGSAVVELRVESATVKTGDKEGPFPGGIPEPVVTTYDKSGNVVNGKGKKSDEGGLALKLVSMTRPDILNDKSLKIGEEWKFDTSKSADAKSQPFTKGALTLVGPEKSGADVPVDTMKVKIITDMVNMDAVVPEGESRPVTHLDGSALIETETGKILMITGKITGLNVPRLGDMAMSFKRVRISADGKK
jgi:hypothetical protein